MKPVTHCPSQPKPVMKKKCTTPHMHYVGFLKQVARMPTKDRKEILKVLKRQTRMRKIREVSQSTKEGVPTIFDSSTSSNFQADGGDKLGVEGQLFRKLAGGGNQFSSAFLTR